MNIKSRMVKVKKQIEVDDTRVDKGTCSVDGCSGNPFKGFNTKEGVLLLCKTHYKLKKKNDKNKRRK